VTPDDARHLRRAFELAREARRRGDSAFGAVLVGADGAVLGEGANDHATNRDPTGHAELNVLRGVGARVAPPALAAATLYCSGEPCPMCAGAIVWAGVGRVVYAVPGPRAATLAGRDGPRFGLGLADVVASARAPVRVEGPVLQAEGEAVFRDG
jgi:tRNA(Arg) A34 adenosine deaminase TadA